MSSRDVSHHYQRRRWRIISISIVPSSILVSSKVYIILIRFVYESLSFLSRNRVDRCPDTNIPKRRFATLVCARSTKRSATAKVWQPFSHIWFFHLHSSSFIQKWKSPKNERWLFRYPFFQTRHIRSSYQNRKLSCATVAYLMARVTLFGWTFSFLIKIRSSVPRVPMPPRRKGEQKKNVL